MRTTRLKSILTVALAAAILFGFAIWGTLKKDDAQSLSERRALAAMPKLSIDSVLSGKFMSEYEQYKLDQFPLRDAFRTLKAVNTYYVFSQRDNNGIYIVDGIASKMDYPLNGASIARAAKRFGYVYDTYLKPNGIKAYLSLVPDKNYFMADANGYLGIDYDKLKDMLTSNMVYAEYIDIFGTLSIEDYYKTDLHWRQERIQDTAKALAEGMGAEASAEYTAADADTDFYGIYYAQSALPLKPDKLYYMQGGSIADYRVYDYESGKYVGVYDMDALNGRDPYEMFLHGSKSVLTIENPNSSSGRSLIMFRDSFASSIAPLIAEGFDRVTLVDIRYVAPEMLGRMVDFTQYTDALFLYGTGVINNSETIK